MDFDFSEEQEMLRTTARDFLQEECPPKLVREMMEDEKGYSPQLWQKMAEMGWMGLAFPEKYGGAGGSFLDLVVLLEEMGRAHLVGPFFSTVVLGGHAILERGSEQQKLEFLPKIASGDMILTLALTEAQAAYDPSTIETQAVADGSDYVINGTKLFVPNANVADYIVCVTRTGGKADKGITLCLIDAKSPGIHYTQMKTISGDKQSEITFEKVRIPSTNIIGKLHDGWQIVEEVLRKAAVGKCVEMVGGAQRVIEMTVGYAKERIQFGQPIGSFQAVQHHCANMLIDADTSKYITYKVAWMLSEGIPCNMEVAVAKAWVSEAYRRVCFLGHIAIGGISVTVDHDMPIYSLGAKVDGVVFGDADFHREVIAQQLGL